MTKQYHHGDLRQALVDAGIELLEQGGVEAVTVRAVARTVGVSHAAPARHFADLASLYSAIAAVGYRRLSAEMDVASQDQGGPLLRLRNVGLAYVQFALNQADLFRLMSHPLVADKNQYPDLNSASAGAFNRLLLAVQDAQNAGYLRDGVPEDLALACWSCVHGISVLLLDDQLAPKGYTSPGMDLAALVLDQLFLGLRSSQD